MIILMRGLCLLLLLHFRPVFTQSNTSAQEECRKRIAECATDNAANTPVCGSDGVTYPSKCKVYSSQCQGASVLIKHTGPCAETPPCLSAKLTARLGSRPSCRPDGTYAPVQCHQITNYCWCVTPQGRNVPNTAVRHRKPRCGKTGPRTSIRSGQKRRSSPSRKNRRHHATCDREDKNKFNDNLIENFKIEYRRTNISTNGDKNVERVLAWKFGTLDENGDGFLDTEEYKELRRLAKRAVRPKKCARTFTRTCDLNRDSKLSRQEWAACLSNDFTPPSEDVHHGGFPGMGHAMHSPMNPALHPGMHSGMHPGMHPGMQSGMHPGMHPEGKSTPTMDHVLKVHHPGTVHARPAFNDAPPETNDESDANDCTSDRRSALETNAQQKFYVPLCTSDGRYQKVQCYSGYCWCVHQDSGKPIPGTASKDNTPNCNPVPTPSRPIKGCPESKKQAFLRDLMDLMKKKKKSSNPDSEEVTVNWPASEEEQVATWHFVMLDKNKNKVLERKEWKSFRTMVANNRQLRRCGKKLPRYCDINNDRRISMTEWHSCLNVQRPASGSEQTSTTRPRRLGPNPLDRFLNDDD